jgi:hypothetical protein
VIELEDRYSKELKYFKEEYLKKDDILKRKTGKYDKKRIKVNS